MPKKSSEGLSAEGGIFFPVMSYHVEGCGRILRFLGGVILAGELGAYWSNFHAPTPGRKHM